jgi:hypothetical protein
MTNQTYKNDKKKQSGWVVSAIHPVNIILLARRKIDVNDLYSSRNNDWCGGRRYILGGEKIVGLRVLLTLFQMDQRWFASSSSIYF